MTAKTWTGKAEGVRAPMTGETQLSPAEVAQGLKDGAFPTTDARAHLPKPRTPKVRTIGWGDATAGLLAMAEKAGAAGITWADIKTSHPEWKPQTISGAMNRHLDAGTLIRRGKGGQIRYWLGTVGAEVADAIHAQDIERSRQRRVEMRRVYSDAHRRAIGNMTRAEYVAHQKARAEAAKSQKARERVERATARKLEKDAQRAAAQAMDADARAAIRKEKADARKLEADLHALEAKEAAAKSTKRHVKAIKKATANINKIADKYRGVNAPSTVPMPQARPKATPVDIPRHLVKVERPMTLPHERIQPTGSFGRIGQYDTEPGHLAVALGVAA
jgi:hypothetical protein